MSLLNSEKSDIGNSALISQKGNCVKLEPLESPFTDKDHCIRAPKSEGSLFNKHLRDFIHIEKHASGGASVVHLYQSEISGLEKLHLEELARLFFDEVFGEDKRGNAHHVMGIVHKAASHLPELVGYMGMTQPDLDVKVYTP